MAAQPMDEGEVSWTPSIGGAEAQASPDKPLISNEAQSSTPKNNTNVSSPEPSRSFSRSTSSPNNILVPPTPTSPPITPAITTPHTTHTNPTSTTTTSATTTATTTTTTKLTKSPSGTSFSFARPTSNTSSAAYVPSATATPTGARLYARDDKKSSSGSYIAVTPRALGSDATRSSFTGLSPAAAAHAAEAARPLEEILESVDSGPVGEVELTELRRLTASARRSEARKTLTMPTDIKKTSVVLTPKVGREVPNHFEGRTSQETLYFQLLNAPPNPSSLVIFMHGVDESLDTPGCAKLAEVWGARGIVVVGIELHRHGRSSYKHGKRATLPPAEVMISEIEELIMSLRSNLLPQHIRLLPFALAGHSLGGVLAILLSYRFSKTLPERFLGCLLFSPAVDTLVDASCGCCSCGCCCAPSFTHCCSLAHPFYACFASCFSKQCCACCLPIDDPSTGGDGYREEKERTAYRNSPYNTIGRFQPSSLKTLIELMRMVQMPSIWPTTPNENPLPFFMLCGDKDGLVPPRSLLSFAKAQGMQNVASNAKPEEMKSKTAVCVCLEKGNHQILGYRRKADGGDEIREDILPLMAAWLESKIIRPIDRHSDSISRRSRHSKDSN